MSALIAIATSEFSRYVEKLSVRPNPPAPFPTREGGEIKASGLVGERFEERSSRCRKKSVAT
ncbi:hypothetical protein [Anabaena azotica]|uniref:Uncharacterized protein n=1 Tax=Anabaena azotica FACHB-119 TaxID=947527 RepID=A0ABR8D8H9_9NOST|nr:hypothetical protein [Anabaena azotica]MBD2503500.1 hypothetical protein [Anabaena azotica FACHB-119]